MPKFIAGLVKFQREVYPARRELFSQLALGQSPEALFITCSDSRIDPNLVTQRDPGELFICRNAGNIVPPHSGATGAMTASVEFAVGALKVPHIVVCGHTDCGAMQAALEPDALLAFPHISRWLNFTSAAVKVMEARTKGQVLDSKARLRMLTAENVKLQLQHLRTHPYVAARMATAKLRLHGWVYDIESGGVLALDETTDSFRPVIETYRHELQEMDEL